MEKARVGGAVAVLVLMLAMLPLLGLATKLLGDGTGRQFYTEPSSAAYETAAAGQNMMGGGFALFAGLSLLSFALLRKLVGGRGPHGTGDRRDRGQHGIHHPTAAALPPSSVSRSPSSEPWPASGERRSSAARDPRESREAKHGRVRRAPRLWLAAGAELLVAPDISGI
jgi:hypothetical protein